MRMYILKHKKSLLLGLGLLLLILNLPLLLSPFLSYYVTGRLQEYGITFRHLTLHWTKLRINGVNYASESVIVDVDHCAVHFRPHELMQEQKIIRKLAVGDVRIYLPGSSGPSAPWQKQLSEIRTFLFQQRPQLPLPLPIKINEIETHQMMIQHGKVSFQGPWTIQLNDTAATIHMTGQAALGVLHPTIELDIALTDLPHLSLSATASPVRQKGMALGKVVGQLNAKLHKDKLTADVHMMIDSLKFSGLTKSLPPIGMQGNALLTSSKANLRAKATFGAEPILLKMKDQSIVTIRKPIVTLEGMIKKGRPHLTLHTTIKDIEIPSSLIDIHHLDVLTDLSSFERISTTIAAKYGLLPLDATILLNPKTHKIWFRAPKHDFDFARWPLKSLAQDAGFSLQHN